MPPHSPSTSNDVISGDKLSKKSSCSGDSATSAASSTSGITVPLTTRALLACLSASLFCVSAGTVVAYTSPAVASINSRPSPFRISPEEETWVGSTYAIGALLGALFTGPLMDGLGRKPALMLTALPNVLGWLVVTCAVDLTVLCAGRALTGLSKGLVVGVAHVYVAEVAPSDKRGMLLGVVAVASVLGNLYEYVFGWILPWTWLAVASAVVPVLALLLATRFAPESPRYLVLVGRRSEAEAVLEWLRDGSLCVERELNEMVSVGAGVDGARPALLHSSFLYPLLITLGVFTLQQFCGETVLRAYAVDVFEAGNCCMDPEVQSILMGMVAVAGTLVATVLLDHVGRRTMLIVSCFGMALCLTASGAFFMVRELDYEYASSKLSWLPTVGMVLTNLCYSLAFDAVPWMMASELFATGSRGRANSACGVWQNACAFVAMKGAGAARDALDTYGVLWLAASVCVVGVAFAACVLPETKQIALEDIEKRFDHHQHHRDKA